MRCRRNWASPPALPSRSTASRWRCGVRWPAASCSASASRSRSWAAACWDRCGSSSRRCCCRWSDKPWRTRAYGLTLLVALSVALPLALCWPLALHMRDPALFALWWNGETLGNYVAFFGNSDEFAPGYYFKNLLWFAWPSLPLILWMLWTRGRGFNGGFRDPGFQVPAVVSVVMLASLVVMPDPKLAYAHSAAGSVRAARGARSRLAEARLFRRARLVRHPDVRPGRVAGVGILDRFLRARHVAAGRAVVPGFGGGLPAVVPPGLDPRRRSLLTLLWIMLVRPARRSNRRAILNWAAGVTLIWGLATTIWLPYLDSRRSYRWVVENASMHMPRSGCVASRDLSEPQRALFYYFAGVSTVREEVQPNHDCKALLVQYSRQATQPPPPLGWTPAWDGHRRGDDTERYILYTTEALSEILRRSADRGHRRRRRQRRGVVPARKVRAARRPRRRRRRIRRQHLGRRRPQHQHADRLSLRAHPSRPSRRERPRRRPVRQAAPTTSCCACRSEP